MSKRILVVEPDADLLESFRHWLSTRDEWDVETVSDGGKALEKIRENGFQALLLNPNLPGHSGEDILEELESENVEGVVAITNSRFSHDSPTEDYETVTHHLVKPVELTDVEDAVAEVLSE